MALLGMPAAQEDGRLTSQNSPLVGGLDARFFYGSEMWGDAEKRKKAT